MAMNDPTADGKTAKTAVKETNNKKKPVKKPRKPAHEVLYGESK